MLATKVSFKICLEVVLKVLLGGGGPRAGGSFETFQSNMYSYALAQRMWKNGWGSRIYGNGEMDEGYFNKIPKNHKAFR